MSTRSQENSTVGSESTPVSHSKGPWETGRDLHGYESHYGGPSIYSADQYMVAETLLGTLDTEGNARLIAAAPDLLDALKELVALVRGECPSLLEEDSGGSARLDMAINDAIAKAEGRS